MSEVNCGRCADCPLVSEALVEAEDQAAKGKEIAVNAFNAPLEELALAVFITYLMTQDKSLFRKRPAVASPSQIAKSYRDSTIEEIDELDQFAADIKQDARDLINGCTDGPVNLTAERDGRVYSVQVCGSLDIEFGESEVELANVMRLPATD